MKLYDSLSKNLVSIGDLSATGSIGMYSCGPTVYNTAHIGNLRSFIMADLLYRSLKHFGRDVRWVMNITDIDDKIMKSVIAQSQDAGIPELSGFTSRFTKLFKHDLAQVGINPEQINFYNVTDYISQIQEFVILLIEKGYAYTADDGSTYFSIEKYQKNFQDYGKLVGEKFLDGKKIGARVKVDEYEKDQLSDFVLWKSRVPEDGNIFWDHPVLGQGRPGWHIECSAINKVAFNSEPTTIHTGGIDLMFPHHTNEIAQSQPLYAPFCKLWSHAEHLLVDGRKMSKSLGNFYVLDDINNWCTYPGVTFRYLSLQSHYRSQQNFTREALTAAHNALRQIFDFAWMVQELEVGTINSGTIPEKKIVDYVQKFDEAISDDLNTAKALGVLWQMLRDDSHSHIERYATLLYFDEVLGLQISSTPFVSPELTALDKAKELDEARAQKNYARADKLRQELEVAGYEVRTTEKATVILPK